MLFFKWLRGLQKLSTLLLIGSINIAYGAAGENRGSVLDDIYVMTPSYRSDQGLGDDYSGNIGVIDYFKVGKRHHSWVQVGGLVPDYPFVQRTREKGLRLGRRAGGGAGYRYLLLGRQPSKDIFGGIYAYYGFKRYQGVKNIVAMHPQGQLDTSKEEKIYNDRYPWSLGGEIGMRWFQLTVSFYGAQVRGEDGIQSYQESGSGWSIRFSAYPWPNIGGWLRIDPFVVFASTAIQTVDDGKILSSTPAMNGGAGVRWILPYLEIETHLLWDTERPGKYFGANWGIAAQINFVGKKDYTIRQARQAVREITQRYQPADYYANMSKTQVASHTGNPSPIAVNIPEASTRSVAGGVVPSLSRQAIQQSWSFHGIEASGKTGSHEMADIR